MADTTPSMADCRRMWESIDFPHLTDRDCPHVMAYVRALEDICVNGSVEFSTFAMPAHPTFDWYVTRNVFHEMDFFQYFWAAPSVRKLFPFELKSNIDVSAPDVFINVETPALGESLAAALTRGGAYGAHEPGPLDAQTKGDAAAAELIGASGDTVRVYASQLAWCDFFWDVIWDVTWIVIDPGTRRIHLFCGTDSD